MSNVVLDAGALIALERDDRAMWIAFKVAAIAGDSLIVPSTVLAQVWRARGSQARLSQALSQCAVAPFDPLARSVGELCAKTQTSDICDAHVALVAAANGGVLYTSDPSDLRPLVAACRRMRPVIVRC